MRLGDWVAKAQLGLGIVGCAGGAGGKKDAIGR